VKQKAEYKVIAAESPVKLTGLLAPLAADGWKPILMTTVLGPAGQGNIITTVILEHLLVSTEPDSGVYTSKSG